MFNINEAATYLGVSRPSIYHYIRRWKIGTKTGRRWMFSQAELDAVRPYQRKAYRCRSPRPHPHPHLLAAPPQVGASRAVMQTFFASVIDELPSPPQWTRERRATFLHLVEVTVDYFIEIVDDAPQAAS